MRLILQAIIGRFRSRVKNTFNIYHARIQNPDDPQPHVSEAERRFCKYCGSCLWVYAPDYPDLMHPFASSDG
jgi:hypothetical protein